MQIKNIQATIYSNNLYNKSRYTHTAHAFTLENIPKIMLCFNKHVITDMMLKILSEIIRTQRDRYIKNQIMSSPYICLVKLEKTSYQNLRFYHMIQGKCTVNIFNTI